jgi:hypothetical protein
MATAIGIVVSVGPLQPASVTAINGTSSSLVHGMFKFSFVMV